jgi:murein DD-endopeptidase MepM/ murein hydrolase activator NlpD
MARFTAGPLSSAKYRRARRGTGVKGIIFVAVAVLFGVFVAGRLVGFDAWWWLTNADPPTLTLSGPNGTVRGDAQLEALLSPVGRVHVVSAAVDDQAIPATLPIAIDTTRLTDGAHRVVVRVADTSRMHNQAEAELTIRSDNTPPRVSVEMNSDVVEQGGTLVMKVRKDEPAVITATMDGRRLELQQEGDTDWGIVGFGPQSPPRPVAILIRATDQVGNIAEQAKLFQVAAHNFTQDRVQVSQRLAVLLEARVRADEDARLVPTYAQVTPTRQWAGRFIQPVQGAIVTEFGEVRSYNGGPFEGHHAGVDFAAAAGTPVVAPAAGVIAVVDQVPLRGNVVIVNHGLGVFTTYAHLSAVDVRQGDSVQAGQPFARVGTTGLSEGPHLHWELWIGGQNVNPMPWTRRAFP